MSVVGSTAEEVRADVREWIGANWHPDLSLLDWRRRLLDGGWAAPSWPVRWHGRGLPAWADGIVASEIAAADAVGTPLGGGTFLAGPTILDHGPDALRERFLAPILTGDETWCQLFSEPGAGSDLAGVTTHAELDGDRWIVNGQKLWNTSAHHADFGILVARTNWDVAKHRGLTYFVIPMHQPGVEVRSLRQMNFHRSFNEVFLTDAEIPRDFVVGEVGDGWKVALTTLSYERRFAGVGAERSALQGGGLAREQARAEMDDYLQTYRWYPQRAGRADLVVEHARMRGADGSPVVRQEIARLHSMARVSEWTAARARAARALGRPPGAEGSLGKLSSSNIARQASSVHSVIGGAHGMVNGPDSAFGGLVAEVLVSTPAQSIAGGTDEIQHNIIGERVLDLPREPSGFEHTPFRDVPRNR
jgi:alkylation response protein AidB-like acyl-CoA dehydrogenase